MVDFRSRQEEEIEKLTRTLKNSRLATSESEARRMAEEMLGISKKVADDFREREKQIYGEQKKSEEHDLAHKQMEQLAANMAKGRSNARLDLSDIGEMRVDKPLKDLVAEEEEPLDKEEDDAVELASNVEEKAAQAEAAPEPAAEEAVEEKSSWDKPSEESKEEKKEAEEVDVGDDHDLDDDSDDGSEEEKSEEAPAKEASDVEAAEEDDSEGATDFSIKELDSAPVKSEDDRQREIEGMEESKIDLSSMFNANR